MRTRSLQGEEASDCCADASSEPVTSTRLARNPCKGSLRMPVWNAAACRRFRSSRSKRLLLVVFGKRGRSVGEDSPDLFCNCLQILIEDKVTRVEPDELGLWQIAQVCLGSGRDKEGILITPDDQRLGLVGTRSRLPARVGCNIGFVVLQKIDLVGLRAGTVEKCLIENPVIGGNVLFIASADSPMELGRGRTQELLCGFFCLGVTVLPQGCECALRHLTHAFEVRIGVLDDEAFYLFRLFGEEAKAHGAAVILHV